MNTMHTPRLAWRRLAAAALATALSATASAALPADAAALPAYVPQPVAVPADAGYRLPDGSIYIVGNDGMKEILEQFNALFEKTHPGFRFTMLLEGSSTAVGGLTAGVSAFGPMGREPWGVEISAFKETYGYEPRQIHIGYDGWGPREKQKSPPGIYVNARNPLTGLTLDDVRRIFTSGAPQGDVTSWRQLGLGGEYAKRRIHAYGPLDDGGLGTSVRTNLLGKRPFARQLEAFGHGADIAKALESDPFGIALLPFFDAGAHPGIRMLPLAAKAGLPFAAPSYENVQAGMYPFTPYLDLIVNRPPGKPLDPFVKEYARMVLSREGQAIIAAARGGEEAYVPLDAAQAAIERAKLD